jgi:transposase
LTCWAHARRKFFDLAQINKAPIAIEAVERFHVLFAIEREINGMTPQERVRNERSWSLVIEAAGRLSSNWRGGCTRPSEEFG